MTAFDPRRQVIDRFLADAGRANTGLAFLPADASTRRYGRLLGGEARLILMDAPPVEDLPCPPDADTSLRQSLGWNAVSRLAASRVEAFAAIAHHLRSEGFAAPDVVALDATNGLALVEDFGDAVLVRQIEAGLNECEPYRAAGELLADLHARPVPSEVTAFGHTWPILSLDTLALQANADLFFEWVPHLEPEFGASDAWAARWQAARQNTIVALQAFPRVLTLRDFHAENLIWRADQSGHGRLGLLDFQDAVAGYAGWDLSMLLQDARRDVSPPARAITWHAYLEATGRHEVDLAAEFALVGALNAARILGIFARLIVRDGKPRYRAFLDREWRHLADSLRHPQLSELRAVIVEAIPRRLEGGA